MATCSSLTTLNLEKNSFEGRFPNLPPRYVPVAAAVVLCARPPPPSSHVSRGRPRRPPAPLTLHPPPPSSCKGLLSIKLARNRFTGPAPSVYMTARKLRHVDMRGNLLDEQGYDVPRTVEQMLDQRRDPLEYLY